jgi:hypothetical protein
LEQIASANALRARDLPHVRDILAVGLASARSARVMVLHALAGFWGGAIATPIDAAVQDAAK